jgi:hypothetical protein
MASSRRRDDVRLAHEEPADQNADCCESENCDGEERGDVLTWGLPADDCAKPNRKSFPHIASKLYY